MGQQDTSYEENRTATSVTERTTERCLWKSARAFFSRSQIKLSKRLGPRRYQPTVDLYLCLVGLFPIDLTLDRALSSRKIVLNSLTRHLVLLALLPSRAHLPISE